MNYHLRMAKFQDVSMVTWRELDSQVPLDQLTTIARTLDQLAAQGGRSGDTAEQTPTLREEAELLRKMAADLRLHLECGQLIASISNRLLNFPIDDLEQGIRTALAELGQFTGVQRTYAFLLSDDGRCLADAYEWCADGAEGHDFASFYGVSVDAFPWSMKQFLRGETVFVDDPELLPPEASAERGACRALSILAYVNLPLFLNGKLIGWLGFDSVTEHKRWTDEEVRFMAISSDIIVNAIQRKRREELLFRQRALSQRIASMGTLAAGLAHEINNPLSFVIGNLSYMRELIDEPSHRLTRDSMSEMRDVLAHAREGADRVRRIVGDLRALARGEDTEIEEVDVISVLDSTLRMASNQLRHRAQVVRDYQDVPLVQANASQLGQVVLNLILNAANALPDGRAADNQITVSTRALNDGEGERVEIAVADTGCGIPADRLSRIFDPFYTTREIGQGMGIGLAICHNIVTAFGGTIDISSQVGKGTTVRVALPRAGSALATQGEVSPERDPSLRILLVDDEPRVLEMLARMLKGNVIVLAGNGREALAELDKGAFDVILCDLMMPDMTGQDVYQSLSARDPDQAERLIFISGGAFSDDTKHFLDSVPNPKLSKPFEADMVRQVVMEASRKGRRELRAR
jgi:two-component system, NtrC family, sensor kinase